MTRKQQIRGFLLALGFVLGAVTVGQVARASRGAAPFVPITVTNTNDSGAGSLRQAIADAQDGDTINFNIPPNDPGCTGGVCTITLTSGVLAVSQDVTISGPGASLLMVSGNNASRVFAIGPDATAALSGLTIMNGNAPSLNSGGGILNEGTLTLVECVLTNNHALNVGGDFGGGGIANLGALSATNCAITGNSTDGNGGGIRHQGIMLTLTGCTLASNQGASGGGVYLTITGQAALLNCTVTNNNALAGAGIRRHTASSESNFSPVRPATRPATAKAKAFSARST